MVNTPHRVRNLQVRSAKKNADVLPFTTLGWGTSHISTPALSATTHCDAMLHHGDNTPPHWISHCTIRLGKAWTWPSTYKISKSCVGEEKKNPKSFQREKKITLKGSEINRSFEFSTATKET